MRTIFVAAMMVVTVVMAEHTHAQSSQGDVFVQWTSRLHERVRTTHPDLLAHRAAVARAEAMMRAAGAGPPATVAVEVGEVPKSLELSRAGSATIRVERDVWRGSQRRAAQDLARIEIDRAVARLTATERRLAAETDHAIVRAVGWAIIRTRLAKTDSLLGAVEDALTTRFAIGDTRYADLLRVRTERLRTRSTMAEALGEANVARSQLLTLLGGDQGLARSLDTVVTMGIARLMASPNTLISWPDSISADSVLASALALRLATIDIARAHAERAVTASKQGSHANVSLGAQRFRRDDGAMTLGPAVALSMSLPFTARHANAAALQAADASIAATHHQRDAVAAALRGAVTTAMLRYHAAREQVALFDRELLRGARDERESALANYRSGTVTLVELLDFDRALTDADIIRIRGCMAVADALAALWQIGTMESSASPSPIATDEQ